MRLSNKLALLVLFPSFLRGKLIDSISASARKSVKSGASCWRLHPVSAALILSAVVHGEIQSCSVLIWDWIPNACICDLEMAT